MMSLAHEITRTADTRISTPHRVHRRPRRQHEPVGHTPLWVHLDREMSLVCQSLGASSNGWSAYTTWCGTRWIAYAWVADSNGERRVVAHVGFRRVLRELDDALAALIGQIGGGDQ
jgi:hypothetical protein